MYNNSDNMRPLLTPGLFFEVLKLALVLFVGLLSLFFSNLHLIALSVCNTFIQLKRRYFKVIYHSKLEITNWVFE